MKITHEEAHRLIQFKVDNSLNATNEEKLSAHLKDCRECQRYFDTIRETESTLRQTMHKQWNVHPLPLQMDAVYARVHSNPNANILVTTRTTLIGIAFVMFAFITWQSMSGNTASLQAPLGTVPMIPTPSTSYTATNTLQSECKQVMYIVQQGDTLESIAGHFSVSKETIIAANNLTSDAINQSRELVIPFCESTPTSTTRTPTFTITPTLQTISTTPG
jgi:hypothetical protein